MTKPLTVVGHRGFRSRYPENTLVSFRKALEFGLATLEFDVHPTRDGHLVITHDHDLDRCSNGHGSVHDLTLDELRALDFGAWKAPEFAHTSIPTLDETLDVIYGARPHDAFALIELKEDDDGCTRLTLDACRRHGILDRCLILSFHYRQLQLLRRLEPTLLLQGFPDSYVPAPLGQPPETLVNKLCLWTRDATPEAVADLQRRGLAVDLYPVDTPDELERALATTCDSITTNCPDVICPLLDERNVPWH